MDYFFHATGSTRAILESKMFKGSNKAVQKLGPEYLAQAADSDLFFMAGKINEHPISAGMGRIKARNGQDTRSILVFTDPNNRVERLMDGAAVAAEQKELAGNGGGYYVIRGKEIPLNTLRLGMIIGFEDDMPAVSANQDQGTAFFFKTISPLISKLAFYSCKIVDMNDAKLNRFLTEAVAHGVF